MQLLIVLGVIIAGVLVLAFSSNQLESYGFKRGKIMVLGCVVAVLVTLGFSVSIIDASEVGVKVIFGRVAGDTVGEGINLINPFAKVVKYSVRLKKFTMNDGGASRPMQARTIDSTKVTVDMTVWYRINAEDAYNIYKKISDDESGVAGIVQPAARSVIRDVVATYTNFNQLNSSRQSFASNALSQMKRKLQDKGVEIVEVLIRSITPPKEIEVAINKKLKRQQEIQEKQYQLKIAEKNKKIAVTEAQGIAESQRIINRSLTFNYLQYMAIKAQEKMAKSKNHTTVYIPTGNNGIPLVRNIK